MTTTRIIQAVLVSGILLLQYQLWFSGSGVFHIRTLDNQLTTIQGDNQKIQQINSILAADVKNLKYGKTSIESRARESMGMIKSNENFYRVMD